MFQLISSINRYNIPINIMASTVTSLNLKPTGVI